MAAPPTLILASCWQNAPRTATSQASLAYCPAALSAVTAKGHVEMASAAEKTALAPLVSLGCEPLLQEAFASLIGAP